MVLLVGCGQPDSGVQAVPTLPRGVIARWQCLGGVHAFPDETVVYADGKVMTGEGWSWESNSASHDTGKVPVSEIEKLNATFASAEWQDLKASYGRNGVDVRGCTITGGGKQVMTNRGGGGPSVLTEVEGQFLHLKLLIAPILTVRRERGAGERKEVMKLRVYRDGRVELLEGDLRYVDGRPQGVRVVKTSTIAAADVHRLQAALSTKTTWENLRGTYDKDATNEFQFMIFGLEFDRNNVVNYTEGRPKLHPLDDILGLIAPY